MLLFLFFCCFVCSSLAVPLQDGTANSRSIGGRIIGGLQATRGQFPFLVGIWTYTSNGRYFCGGTLLNTQWVLTAGHCAYEAVSFELHMGSTNLDENDPYLLLVSTESYVVHPDYDPETLHNDIAAIEFRMPITFTDYIKPVNLLPGATLSDNSPLITMGWGQVSDANPAIQDKIHYITVTTLSNIECRSYYGNQIIDSMACAATNYNGGTCYGDTGGPLIQYVSRLQVMLVGVASFISYNGCESPEPSGFTRTHNYVDWIRNTTGFS